MMTQTNYKLLVNTLDVWYEKLHVLDNLSFRVKEGEVVSIIGPSGCGKSTLLLHIGGFLKNKDRCIIINGQDISALNQRVSILFQDQTLFPWKTLRQNILLGLKKEKLSKESEIDRATKFISEIRLTGFEDYYPHQLSGGMKQRAAIAQACISDPELILMDEPFGSLDALTRRQMQNILLEIIEKNKRTVLMVTHDIEEAILISDSIIVLSKKPAKILAQINIPLPRPRKHQLLTTEQAAHLKKRIMNILENESDEQLFSNYSAF